MDLYNTLKAIKGLPSDDLLSSLWENRSDTKRYFGTVPFTLKAKEGYSEEWQIFGNTNGVGKKTKNIVSSIIKNRTLNGVNGVEISTPQSYTTDFIKVNISDDGNISVSGLQNTANSFVALYDENFEFIGRTDGGTKKSVVALNFSSCVGGSGNKKYSNTAYIRITNYPVSASQHVDLDNVKLQAEINTVPTDYEPYGYKIPIMINNEILETVYIESPIYIGEYIKKTESESIIHFADGTERTIELPKIKLVDGYNLVDIDSKEKPEKMAITYKKG